MEVLFEVKNDVGLLKLVGRLDASNTNDFKEQFNQHAESAVNFVFDLSKCDFIDSTGLGGIVACLKAVQPRNGDIKIAEMSEKPRMVFEITRAHKIFEIFDNVEAAILSYEID